MCICIYTHICKYAYLSLSLSISLSLYIYIYMCAYMYTYTYLYIYIYIYICIHSIPVRPTSTYIICYRSCIYSQERCRTARPELRCLLAGP